MKLLENSQLSALSSTLTTGAIDCIIDFKAEMYSSKMVQSDKRQWRSEEKNGHWSERQPLGPPDDFSALSASPVATIGHAARLRHMSERSCSGSDNDVDEFNYVDSVSKKTLYHIAQVLNMSYPDYDFTNVQSDAFSLVNYEELSRALDSKLSSCVHNYKHRSEELWSLIEDAIAPSECKIFSFKPQYSDDPFTEDGCIWSVAFIFYNKCLKRFMLVACRCLSKHLETSEIFENFSEDEDDDNHSY